MAANIRLRRQSIAGAGASSNKSARALQDITSVPCAGDRCNRRRDFRIGGARAYIRL
jgi:hypothetical protein